MNFENMPVKWKNGYRPNGADAQAVFNELESLRKEKGHLLPEDIVEMAKPESSAAHPIYEWDDKIAGHEYRLEQARRMTRSFVYVEEKAPQIGKQRVYIQHKKTVIENNEPKNISVYSTMEEVLSDPVTRDQVLARAISEAAAYRKKYADLQELSKVFMAIDDFVLTFKA